MSAETQDSFYRLQGTGIAVCVTQTAICVHVVMECGERKAERYVTWYEIEYDPEAVVNASRECYHELTDTDANDNDVPDVPRPTDYTSRDSRDDAVSGMPWPSPRSRHDSGRTTPPRLHSVHARVFRLRE